MSTSVPDLDDFETRLLHELREQVVREREESRAQATRRSPARTRARQLGAAAAAAAAALAGVLVVPGLGAGAAYSVQEGNAGEIVVTVDSMRDADGLEAALAEHGISADVTYLADGKRCAPGRYPASAASSSGLSLSVGLDTFEVTIAPGTVRTDETLVLAGSIVPIADSVKPDGTRTTEGFRAWVSADVVEGSYGECVPQ